MPARYNTVTLKDSFFDLGLNQDKFYSFFDIDIDNIQFLQPPMQPLNPNEYSKNPYFVCALEISSI